MDTLEPDHLLLRRFAAGERAALGELANQHEKELLGLARGLLNGDAHAACDAVQATWVRVIRYAHSFKGRSSVKTWLYRILINECRDLRRAKPQPIQPRLISAMPADDDAGASLQAALARVSEPKREVLLLCYHAGLTHAIAADVLDIPVGTLKSRLHAAMNELRATLGEDHEGAVA